MDRAVKLPKKGKMRHEGSEGQGKSCRINELYRSWWNQIVVGSWVPRARKWGPGSGNYGENALILLVMAESLSISMGANG